VVIYRGRWININATHYDLSPSVVSWVVNFDYAKLREIEVSLAGCDHTSHDYISAPQPDDFNYRDEYRESYTA
jgi:hypothetical protein